MITTAHGRQIGLKLFLEGIEVDLVSATVQSGMGAGATAQIAIPAPPQPFEFYPRTLVHLFFWEGSPSLVPDVSAAVGTQVELQVSDDANKGADFADSWRLLFCGEALSYSFVKSGDQRHLVLACSDFTSYWQQIKLYWGTNTLTGSSTKNAVAAGAVLLSRNGKDPVGNSGLVDLLAGRSSTVPDVPGLLGGIVGLLEAAVGVYDKKAKRNFRGVNDWASQAELRLSLTRMIAASPLDDTSETFVRFGDLKQYFSRLASQVRSTSSFLELAQTFLQKIYHTHASIAAPPFMPKGAPITLQMQVPAAAKFKQQPDLDEIRKMTRATMAAIGERQLQARAHEDVIVTSGTGGSYDGAKVTGASDPDHDGHEKWAKGDVSTKGLASGALTSSQTQQSIPSKKQMIEDASKALANNKAYATTAAGDSIRTGLGTALTLVDLLDTINTSSAVDTKGKKVYPKHDSTNLQEALNLARIVDENLARALQTPMKTIKRDGHMSSRLNCTLLMPDLFMVPPPKCNVLFPTQYMSVHYSRAWMSEPTRLIMHGLTAAGAEGKTIYFSPNRTTGLLIGTKDQDATAAVQHGTSFLMPHELMTGPIPAFENLGDMPVFRKINEKLNKDATAQAKADGKKPANMYTINEFMQRAANFVFISKRFEGRTMQVECRFSPQLVSGLPLLLLDPQDAPKEDLTEADSTHYVGQVASITHQFTSTGGCSTSITLQKCRRADEGVRGLFTDDSDEYTHVSRTAYARKSKTETMLSTTDDVVAGAANERIRAIAKKQGYDALGAVAGQGTVFDGNTGVAAGKTLTFHKGGRNIEITATPNITLAAIAKNMSSQPEGKPVYTGDFDVVTTESGVRKRTETVPISFEAAFTPPWFATIYQAHNIGKQFYTTTLGCGSVVDDPALHQLTAETVVTTETGAPAQSGDIVNFTMPDGAQAQFPADLVLYSSQNTQEAAANLSAAYKRMKQHGADVERFVDQYCARSYATLPDILGNANAPGARYVRPLGLLLYPEPTVDPEMGPEVLEGFHENAFGALDNLLSTQLFPLQETPLATPEQTSKGVRNPETRNVSPKVDTRSEKYARVEQYRGMMARIRTSAP